MELSWTTFVLEIVNFLVLVWILKRFLYQPVLDVIARRKAAVEKTMSDAKSIEAEANKLKGQYEGRLSEADQERQQAREKLHKQIDEERKKQLDKVKSEVEAEREKRRAVDEKRLSDALRSQEETAVSQGAAFAARLLGEVADEHLHRKLVDLALAQLSQLSDEQAGSLRSAYDGAQGRARVSTAFDLPDDVRGALEARLREILSADVQFDYARDEQLKAGLRVVVGPWVLHANIQDELKAFAESVHESD